MAALEMYIKKTWFDKNKISLNLSKTKIMLFENFQINSKAQIHKDCVEIEKDHEHKFLDFWFIFTLNKLCIKQYTTFLTIF